MPIELNGQNDIVRRNGNLPDEIVATKAGPSLTAEEVAYLESLPLQSKLKQAYLQSTAKTVLPGYQVAATQALVSEAWMSDAILALIGYHPTRVYLDSQPLWLDNSPILS